MLALVVAGARLVDGVREARSTTREATQVVIGRTSPVTFDRRESFTVYYFGPQQVSDASDVPDLAQRLATGLRPVGGGAPVGMEPYGGSTGIQSRGGLQQVAIATFRIDQPGDYVVTSNPITGVGPFDGQLILTPSPFRPLARGALIAGAFLAAGTVLSLVSTIALAVTRGRSKRAVGARLVPALVPGSQWDPVGSAPWLPGPVRPGAAHAAPIVPPPPPGYGPRDVGR